MWIFLQVGFLSVVAHRDKPEIVLVRARQRDAVEYVRTVLAERGGEVPEIVRNVKADYPWRLEVRRDDFAAFLAEEARTIRADNFKNAATRLHGHSSAYVLALHEVWGVLWERLAGFR